MTREEAINWIRLDIEMAKFDPSTGEEAYLNEDAKKVIEAQEMAIEALRQPEPCEDAVSRTDVFNAVRGEERGGYVDETVECMLKVMSDLPPVTPEQKIGKFVRWMEKRETPKYISFTPHCKCSLCGNELFIENINYCYMCGARLVEDRVAERREE